MTQNLNLPLYFTQIPYNKEVYSALERTFYNSL